MQTVFRRIALVAPTRANVLIVSESGTEAPAVARAVHAHSPRCTGPFVSFRATAFEPDRVAAALCGDELEPDSGGGLLAGAVGGTVFLDDLAAIPPAAQVRLLPLIDRQEIVAVGAVTGRPADVRVIAAVTDPAGAVRAGRLRQDLAARLNVYQIVVPPLRDRITDLPELVDHLLRALGAPPTVRLTPAALVALQTRPWPGNVRELRDVLALALARAGSGAITAEHLPPPTEPPAEHGLRVPRAHQ